MNSRIMTAMIGSGMALIAGGVAHADIVQNEFNSNGQIFAQSPTGQSFTAVDSLIASIRFAITDLNPASGAPDLTVTLFEGSGFGGSILATQTILFADIAANTFLEGLWNDFVFDSPVALTLGNVYTAQISTTTARWGANRFQGIDDVYAGGTLFANGGPIVGEDSRFRVLAAPPVIPLPSCDVVMDFEILAEAGVGVVNVGETYSEDGYTLNEIGVNANNFFASWRLDDNNFAGSTGLFNNEINSTIELVKDDGGAFRLAAIDLAPLLFLSKGLETSVTFVGELDGNPVAMQTFTTSVAQPFETFIFNSDFAKVDRVTWVQSNSVGTVDFHQFDEIVLTRAMPTVIDFESLAQAGSGIQIVASPYLEDGFSVNGNLGSVRLDDSRFASSTGVFDRFAGAQEELVKQRGGAFRLAAIDLAPLNNGGVVTTVTFTGELDGSPVASQMFTTTTAQAFQSFIFNDDFKHVDRVTWIQSNNGGTTDFHQFDDIVLGDANATILESATLGPTGLTTGPFASDQFLGNRFSLSEPARVTEIGGHILVDSGSIWGAIVPLSGPNALPPFGFDVEANALAHALFEFTDGLSADLCQPVDVILPPGDYALLFGGGGFFGSTGIGNMPANNPETPQANDFFRRSNDGMWIDGSVPQTRFVVRGTPIPCNNCIGDANGNGLVNFGDVTTVLGNWLTICPTGSDTIFETATPGPTSVAGGAGLGEQYIGVRFSLTDSTVVTAIGAHINEFGGGTLWGAIFQLDPMAFPPSDFDVEANALAHAIFPSTGATSAHLLEPVNAFLEPGDYVLVLGGNGLFGTTSIAGALRNGNPSLGSFPGVIRGVDGNWGSFGIFDQRFVIEGEVLCSTCEGDADFSGTVNFGDVTTVLGNWLAVCP